MTNRIPFPWHDAFQRELITVACPTCRAEPGTPCTIRRGPPARVTHLARADRALRRRKDTT